MTDFDLPPDRAAAIRRAETLSRKINLLLDVIMSESGKPFDFPAIHDNAKKLTGYEISRTRWSLLKSGKEQVISDELLRAIAASLMSMLTICARKTESFQSKSKLSWSCCAICGWPEC